jgi:DegV family protein with EDD domain
MRKVTIVVDSTACLLKEHIIKLGIEVVPLNIHFDGSIYRDGVDIDAAKAYEFLEHAPELFASSPASPEEYATIFRKEAEKGHDILCFTISSKISTMHNMASVGKEIVNDEIPEASIEIIDSLTVTASEGLLALETARFAEQNKNIQEVKQFALATRQKVNVIFVIETLKYVYRTGRIPEVASKIGGMLPIKPILTIRNGKAHITAASRTTKNGIQRMIEIVKKSVGDAPIRVAIQHAQVFEEGEALRKTVESELNCEDIYLTEFSPIMGYATGPGALGIAYYRL